MAETPEVGLVIRHMYLWRNEKLRGKEDGRKARPCLIVHKRHNEYKETEVFICPITHTPPANSDQAIEIPLATKQRLKLDDDRSWVITNEANRFTWKGPDVRKTQAGEYAYGFLPHNMIEVIIAQVLENARGRSLKVVDRDDAELTERMRKLRQKKASKPPAE